MSRRDKLLARLRSNPVDFTWQDAVTLMKGSGFDVIVASGSGRKFVHRETRRKVLMHQPHPHPELKQYQIDLLLEGLRNAGEID
jgi:predicted RNA binding protein YcfA (HicA-like mRNA interferase family)